MDTLEDARELAATIRLDHDRYKNVDKRELSAATHILTLADEVELLRTAQAALRHGLQCIAEQPTWTDHHARAAGILRQVPTV